MEIYKRLYAYIKPYWWILAIALVFMVLAAASEVLVSGVIYVTTNGLLNRDVVTLEDIPHIPPQFAITFDVIWVPFIIVFVFMLKGLLSYFAKYLMAIVGLRSVRDIQRDLYEHISYLSCDYFSRKHSGDLMSRIVRDVNGIQAAITSIILDVIKSPLTILFVLPVIFVMGGKFALISVGVFPLVAIPIVLLGRKLRKLTRRSLESNADIFAFLQETLVGIRIVKAFNAEERENVKFRALNQRLYNFARKSVRAIELQRPVIEIMGAVGVAIAIYFALKTLPLDRFMTFAGSLYLLYEPAKKLSKINVVVQQTLASGKRIFEVMDAPRVIVEKENALTFTEKVKNVQFNNVSFNYDHETPVLRDINFTVANGECFAFVGLSGAGKTSLVNLIPRFYDPTAGSITINGKDIKNFTLKSLRDLVGIVSQETILFSGTIRDNIAYGKENAREDEIVAAAKAAHAHTFIETLPEGYSTSIGIRGMNLSGGERQRISIARAILKNPPILIFDEATSHLDSESEREVQKAIDNLMSGRTVFVIAHRLSTIKYADTIIVLEGGRIVESGAHNELIRSGGVYKHLYDLQFSL